MIGLIPLVHDDLILSALYLVIIAASFRVRYDKRDVIFLAIGFVVLFFSEYFFISTGVEIFLRRSLFGVMPLWLPLLWGYAFVVMRRGIVILEEYLK